MATSAAPQPVTAVARPSRIRSLGLTLDLSCPIVLPSRAGAPPLGWPVSSDAEADPNPLRRRYLSTLLLPEPLAPLNYYTADLISNSPSPADIRPLLLPLPSIEHRHRRVLLPLLIALADGTSSPDVKRARVDDAVLVAQAAGVREEEWRAIEACVQLRAGSRGVEERGAGVVVAKRLGEVLERREILMQTILLLVYIQTTPQAELEAAHAEPTRKKRRRKDALDDPAPAVIDPATQPARALGMLLDRMAVWMAMADLDVGAGGAAGSDGARGGAGAGKGKGREEESVADTLHRFWKDVVRKHFLPTLPDLCASFHLKIFNTPLHPPSTKKPRKPQLTRAKPSSDDIPVSAATATAAGSSSSTRKAGFSRSLSTQTQAQHTRERERDRALHRIPSRSFSRAPSEISLGRQSPPPALIDMHRSTSHTSHASGLDVRHRRSRSRSMDVGGSESMPVVPVRKVSGSGSTSANAASAAIATTAPVAVGGLSRQPSGKDLFKGRQVGLMRRSASGVMRRDRDRDAEGGESLGFGRSHSQSQSQQSQSQGQSLSGGKGLFGRKTSDTQKKTTAPAGTAAVAEAATHKTLVLATPSKPRHGAGSSQGWAGAHSQAPYAHACAYQHHHADWPTPIAEDAEYASGGSGRASRVAETPVARGRMAGGPGGGAGAGGGRRGQVLFQPARRGGGDGDAEEETDVEDDVESLGGLMVPTDDEDEGGNAEEGYGWEDEERGGGGAGGVGHASARVIPETPMR